MLSKSGLQKEALPLLVKCGSFDRDLNFDNFEYASLLFVVGDFSGCLDEIDKILQQTPAAFSYLILQVRALGKLGRDKLAKTKLRELRAMPGENSGQLLWYSSIAREFNDSKSSNLALLKVISLLKNGLGKLNGDAVHALRWAGYDAEILSIVKCSDPKTYSNVSELSYVFGLAKTYGVYKTALAFGEKILSLDPSNSLRAEVERLRVSKGFLMT